ncbi:ATP-binding cassette domain-containing protein [Streptomyces flavochromogenes]|uniref:ATP-binding cassette domain-containing protein n=1 Tax=Streptomyces flavochromogenes TaxID=68199 RepID=A0ABW6Y1G6_9ACTN
MQLPAGDADRPDPVQRLAGADVLAPTVPVPTAVTGRHVAQHVPEPVYAISVRGLVKSYPGPRGSTTHAVRGVDLDVAQGETFAFLGPNGAGKSTTIAVLCALARPTAGHATVAGADVLSRPHEVRRRVGMLFQHSALDADLTADQNLHIHARLYGLSRRHARSRAAEVLETAGLTDRRRSPVGTLSGGMRRRLEIARALLHSPRVLFLDEPTTGLDPHARAQVWDHLRALRDRQGSTLFVTTHYLEEAENCERIAIIDRGRVVAMGTPLALKAAIGDDLVVLRTSDDTAARRVVRGVVPPDRAVAADSGGVSLRVPDGSTWIPRLCAALQRHGIAVHAAAAAPPTLDDVFFHHTGRSLDTTERHPTPAAPAAPCATTSETGGSR